MREYYKILGIPANSSKAEIKRAYRRMAMKYHPDRNPDPGALAIFNEIQEAYEVLYNGLQQPIRTPESAYERRKKQEDERIKKAKHRWEEQAKQEYLSNERYFRKLTSGKQWRIFTIGSLIMAGFAIILVLELLLPKHYDKDQFLGFSDATYGGFKTESVQLVQLKNAGKLWIEVVPFFDPSDYQNCFIQRSWVFHSSQQIIQPRNQILYAFSVDFNIQAFFPWTVIFFLIPLFTYWYKRKNTYFSILYNFSYYALFPLGLVFLCTNDRWLHLLTLGFL